MLDSFALEGSRLTAYIDVKPNITIPEYVKEISDCAFYGDPIIEKVILSESIETIGVGAFQESHLQTINLPKSLQTIEECAFSDTRLSKIYIPGSVKKLEHGVFWGCHFLRDAVLEEGVRVIGDSAFSSCEKLRSITIPDSVQEIHPNAFIGCTGIEIVRVSQKWRIDNPALLHRVLKHASAKVRAGYIYDGNGFHIAGCVFVDYFGNSERVEVPAGVTAIWEDAFRENRTIKEVKLPDGLQEIGWSAFDNCKNLQFINFPRTVEKINNFAFSGCQKLRHITLPQNLRKLGGEAFYNSGLESITIPGGVKGIDPHTFSLCRHLRKIKLEEGVTRIERFAFSNLVKPIAINIPDSIIIIHPEAFKNTRIARVDVSEVWKKKHTDLWQILKNHMEV